MTSTAPAAASAAHDLSCASTGSTCDVAMALHAFLGASEPLTRLGAGRVLIDTVLGQRRDDVRTALAAGCSWLEIAEALDDSELGVLLDHHLVADPEATHQ